MDEYVNIIMMKDSIIGTRDGKGLYLSNQFITERFPVYKNDRIMLVNELFHDLDDPVIRDCVFDVIPFMKFMAMILLMG